MLYSFARAKETDEVRYHFTAIDVSHLIWAKKFSNQYSTSTPVALMLCSIGFLFQINIQNIV